MFVCDSSRPPRDEVRLPGAAFRVPARSMERGAGMPQPSDGVLSRQQRRITSTFLWRRTNRRQFGATGRPSSGPLAEGEIGIRNRELGVERVPAAPPRTFLKASGASGAARHTIPDSYFLFPISCFSITRSRLLPQVPRDPAEARERDRGEDGKRQVLAEKQLSYREQRAVDRRDTRDPVRPG